MPASEALDAGEQHFSVGLTAVRSLTDLASVRCHVRGSWVTETAV
jgi:hypothetical protein